jgi:prepilin-type processing-associated H-X9-DG protein
MPKRYSLFGVPLGQWLTALVIIALIYAIIFPVFQKVHEGSRPSCQSNLKQLGLALIQYTQDADEKYPPGVNAAGNGWAGQIYPYTKSTYVYHCPDDPHNGSYVSYAENQNIVRQKLENFTDPASTVALYEFTTLNCDPAMPEAVSATGISAPQDSTRHDSPQAPFALNFLMVDGSVKWLTPGRVSGGAPAVSPKMLPQGPLLKTFAVK